MPLRGLLSVRRAGATERGEGYCYLIVAPPSRQLRARHRETERDRESAVALQVKLTSGWAETRQRIRDARRLAGAREPQEHAYSFASSERVVGCSREASARPWPWYRAGRTIRANSVDTPQLQRKEAFSAAVQRRQAAGEHGEARAHAPRNRWRREAPEAQSQSWEEYAVASRKETAAAFAFLVLSGSKARE